MRTREFQFIEDYMLPMTVAEIAYNGFPEWTIDVCELLDQQAARSDSDGAKYRAFLFDLQNKYPIAWTFEEDALIVPFEEDPGQPPNLDFRDFSRRVKEEIQKGPQSYAHFCRHLCKVLNVFPYFYRLYYYRATRKRTRNGERHYQELDIIDLTI